MGSTNFCRGFIIFKFLLIISVVGLKAQPVADFSFVAPTPNCNPAVYSFTNLSTGIAPISYEWNFGVYPGVNSVFQNPSTTFLNCGNFNVQLIVTDGIGIKDTVTYPIVIWCLPTASYSVDNSSGCLPFNESFTSTSTPGSGILTDFVWDFGDGYSGTGTNPYHTYQDEGCKLVTLIATNSYNCVADTTISDVLCVYTPPQAGFTSSVVTSCSVPFTVSYQDTSLHGLAPFSYQWIFNGGFPATDTTANPVVTYNSAGNYSAVLIVTDANGCTDTITNDNYIVIANNTSSLDLSSDHGCPPFSLTLNGVSSSSPIGWNWSISPSGIILDSTVQSTSVSISDTGVFSLCLNIDYGSGCIAQSCTAIISHPSPEANYSINGLLNTCLRPNPISFIDSSTGSNLSYAWSFSGGFPSSANTLTPDTINYVACGIYSASLTVTDDFGCVDTYSSTDFLTINCPVANFIATPSSGCIPLSVNFNSTTSTSNPIQWEWNFGDPASGILNIDYSQNPSHVYNVPGCYTVSLITTNAEGCKDTIIVSNAICCSTPPTVAFSATPAENCANLPIYFTNQATGIYSYTTYTWDFHGVPDYNNESTNPNPTYIYNDTGLFDVTLIVSNYGCSDTLTINDMVHLLPPVANITLTRSCALPYVITLNGSGSIGADTYTWVIPGGNPSFASTPIVSVTYTTTGNHSASLFVTNASTGCTDQMNVNIPVRDIAAHFTGTPLSGCAPLISCMTNTSVDAVSYAWLVSNSSGSTVATSSSTSPCFTLSIPGIYNVRLIATDQFGCKDTLDRPSYITVWGPIVDFVGTPLIGCAPLVVDFADLSSVPTSSIVSWSWSFGDTASGINNSSNLQNPVHTFINPGFYTIGLTITDNHGCTKTNIKTNYIQVVQPTASFLLTDTTICLGNPACFINTSTGTGLTYEWGFGNGTTSTTSNPCFLYNNNGNYTITLIVTDATGCTDTAEKNSYVNVTHPVANLIADTTNSSCPPLTVHFLNLATDIDANSTYYWKFGDGQVSSAPNPSHIYNMAGTFDVTLIVTNQNGCKDTIVFDDYINIGGPEGHISQLPTSGCVPHFTCFEAESASTISFTWNFGDGTVIVNGDSICHTYVTTGTFYSELILNDGIGCVYALPIGIVEVNGANCVFNLDNPVLCENGNVQFSDASYGTSPITQWNWNFGDLASGAQNSSSLQNPSHFFASPGVYPISLSIVTIDGCTNSYFDTVLVQSAPIADFARGDSSICAPDSVHFFDLTISTSPTISWSWNFGDAASGINNTDTLQNSVHFYQFPGTYSVTLTTLAANGCSDSYTIPVYVHDTVIANAGADKIICYGQGAVLNATGGALYTWIPSIGLSDANISSPVATPIITTSYTVIVSNIWGCSDIDSVNVIVNPVPVISSLTANDDTCSSGNAVAIVNAMGGTSPFTYFWNSIPSQNDSVAYSLSGGNTYSVIVTDANGCTVLQPITIADLPGPVINAVGISSTCGISNGTVNVVASGGNGSLIYVWNTTDITQSINNLLAGNYEVTVSDDFNCEAIDNVLVSDLAGPTASIAHINPTCELNNGTINLIIYGGNAPFYYLWSNGASTQDLSSLNPGIYSVTVTDQFGCVYSLTDSIQNQPSPLISATVVNATCHINNGSIDLNIMGGTAPFLINWNNGAYSTEDLNSVLSGAYTVLVTDQNGCTATATFVISDTPIPVLTYTTIASTCGSSNGSIDLTVTGGVAPYTYLWWNGETTEYLSGFPAGAYGITVIGANGCLSNTIITLNDLTAPTLTLSQSNNTCGNNNGSIDLTISGGAFPFAYQWSGGETTQDILNLAIGTYTVTVIDGNGCLAFSNTTLINIQGPSLSTFSANSSCGYTNGSINLVVTNGTAPYTYTWSSGQSTQDLSNVISGIYSVAVSDSNNCIATTSDSLNNIAGPSLSHLTQNSTCLNSNGSVDVSIIGGTAPYTYDWNSGAYSSEDLINVPSGVYNVIVSDQNGCTVSDFITLNNTAGPTLSVSSINSTCANSNGSIDLSISGGTAPFFVNWNSGQFFTEDINNLSPNSYTVVVIDSNNCESTFAQVINNNSGPIANSSVTNATCASGNGEVLLTITGGTMPFSYLWSNGSTIQDIQNLAAGNYEVTITDSNYCVTVLSAIISDVSVPISVCTANNSICGSNNGSVDLTVVSGVSPYNYSWSNGNTTQNLSGLAPGLYYVTILDQNNCVLIDTAEVLNSNSPSLSASHINSNCGNSNGHIYLSINNGATPYSFQWSNGALSQNINYISAGSYTVTVTDGNGCTVETTESLINITGPSSLSFGSQSSICGNSNGMVWVNASGGTAPYSYNWNTVPLQTNDTAFNLAGGTSYSVTVTDANLCTISGSVLNAIIAGPTSSISKTNCTCNEINGGIDLTVSAGTAPFLYSWNNGESTSDLDSLQAGLYTVTISDGNGCLTTISTTITNVPSPSVNYNFNNTTCGNNNGSIDLIIIGGTAPFFYDWNSGQFATQDLLNLAAGNYLIHLVDAAGCQVDSVITLLDHSGPTVSLITQNATCNYNNGFASAVINGGTAPFEYLWSNGVVDSFNTSLLPGSYTFQVTDSNGCVSIDTVVISNTSGPSLTATHIDETCGSNNGSININLANGTAPFIYDWNSGLYNTQNLSNLSAGTYFIVVVDANSCQAISLQTIDSLPAPVLVSIITNSLCSTNNGSIDITITGGATPYNYNWSNGATTEDLNSLVPGIYILAFTDGSGCSIIDSFLVSGSSIINTSILATNANCGISNGSIDLTVTGGTMPYAFNWSNSETNEDIDSLSDGLYVVNIFDSLGCAVSDSVVLVQNNSPELSIYSTNETCTGYDGAVDIDISGGTLPFVFNWSNGASTEDISGLSAGSYSVTVTDVNGCSVVSTADVLASTEAVITYTLTDANCSTNTGAIDVSIFGGSYPLTFLWSNGATTEDINSLYAGSYSMTVTDFNGCNSYLTIAVQSAVTCSIQLTPSPSNCNLADGSIDLTVVGTPAFSYIWSNNDTTEDIVNLLAGYYSVTVTDANGCFVVDSAFVSYSSGPIAFGSVTQPTCSVSTGAIDLSVLGGTLPYSYLWSNSATTEDLLLLTGGNYSVTVIDAIGCQTFGNFSVIDITPINLSVTNVAPMCQGSSVVISASGAVSYSWSPTIGLSTSTGSNVLATPVVSTTYTITGFDSVGCFDTVSVAVIISPLSTISSTTSSNLICFGDSALIVVTGGSSLIWSPVSSLSFISMHSAYATPTSLTTYTITESNALGCTSSTSVVINVMPQYTISVSSSDTDLCSGESTTLIASGALSYSWFPSTGLNTTTGANVIASPSQTTTYFVTGTNASGCNVTDSIVVIVHPPVVVDVSPFNPSICLGSSINLTATGAVYYIWTPSSGLNNVLSSSVIATPTSTTTYTVTGTDSFGCIGYNAVVVSIGTSFALYLNDNAPSICLGIADTINVSGAFNATYSWSPSVNYLDATGANVTVNPNASTIYTVIATDANGCTGSTTANVTVNNPPVIASTNAQACLGTSASLTVSGAANYFWFPSTGISNSTGNSQIASPDSTTIYTIIGVDLNGCADTSYSTFTINPLPVLSAVPSATSICNGSSATIVASGANVYQWAPSIGLSASTGASVVAQPLVSTTYTLFGTNPAGCTNSVTAVVNVGAPVTIINTPIYPSICLGDSLIITLSGASSYQWSPSTGLSSSIGITVVATPVVSTNYLVVGTDVNGCTGFTTIDITVNPNIVMTGSSESVCIGQSATLNSSGAYFYVWNPDVTLNSYYDSTVIATPITNTTYTLTGMNMYGCTDTALYSVTVNPLPNVSIEGLVPFYCSNSLIDSLTMNPTGGILFGSGVLGNTFNPSLAGIGGPFFVTYSYTDSFGCSSYDNDTTFVGGNALIVAATNNTTICNGSSTILSVSGGLNYNWSPSIGLSSLTGDTLVANPSVTTTYFVSGVNADGCSGTDSVTVFVSSPNQISIIVASDSICAGTSTTISLLGSLNYSWQPSVQSSNSNGSVVVVSPSISTTYTVSAVDSNGCSNDTIITIFIIPQLNVLVNSPIICGGDSAILVAQGASSYNWISLSSLNDSIVVQPLITTSYTVIGLANSCSDTATAIVTVLAPPILSIDNDTICLGSQGILFASGATNYTWLPGGFAGDTIVVAPNVTSTYTLIGNIGSCVDSINAIVIVNQIPDVSFIGFESTYCANSNPDTLIGIPTGGTFSGDGIIGNVFYPNLVTDSIAVITYSYTDSNGCFNDSSISTIIIQQPTLTVASTAICFGDSATLVVQGASNYIWLTVPSTNDTINVQPVTTTSYTVIGFANSCSDTAVAVVNILPPPSTNVIDDTICSGASATLIANGASNYTWFPGNLSGNSITVSPTTTSTYTIIGNNGSCDDTTIAIVVVNQAPIVSFSGLEPSYCANNLPDTLIGIPAGGVFSGIGVVGNIFNSNLVSGATDITYTYSDANGCAADTMMSSTVNLQLTIAVNSVSICNGDSATLIAQGASNYNWISLSTTNDTVNVSPGTTTSYTVIGYLNSCTDTQVAVVSILNPPVTSVNSDTICAGSTTTLIANGATNYTWMPGGFIGSSLSIAPLVTTTFTVIGSNGSCADTTSTIVVVNPLPTISFVGLQPSYCSNNTIDTLIGIPSGGVFSGTGVIGNSFYSNLVAGFSSTVSYSYTDINGCQATDSQTTVINSGALITVNSPLNTICSANPVSITAIGGVSYAWSPSTGLNVTTGANVIAMPLNNSTYTVIGIDANGCSGQATAIVAIDSNLSVNITATNDSICLGQTISLTAFGGSDYIWSPSVYLASTTGSTVSATPTANITYTVFVSNANGCTGQTSIPVSVLPNPVVTVSNDTICNGQFANLNASGASLYHWSTNALGSTISVNPTITTSYFVVGMNGACADTASALVVVNQLPLINVASNQNSFCQGQTSILTATGAITYEWFPSFGLNATSGAVVITSPASTTTYTIVGTNSNGCTSSQTIDITIFQLPMAAVGFDVELCEGSNLQLNATGGTSYEWSPQAGLDNPFISDPIASPTGTTSYIVNVGNQNGCYAKDTVNITVHLTPSVNAGASQTICISDSVILNGTGASFYSWTPSVCLNDSSLQNPTCIPQFNITYTLTVTDSFGCNATDTVSVKVLRPFTISADPDISICKNDQTQLNAFGGNNYQWSPLNGLDNSTISNPVASPSETTTYIVISNDGQCFSAADTVVITVNQLPIVYAGTDVDLLYGSTYQLYGYTNGSGVEWSPADFLSCTDCINPVVNHLNTPMTYLLTATDSLGCKAEASVHISLTCNEDLVYVPNAFTPNGDNKNDIFRIRTYGLSEVKAFRVFNRWGEMVFESFDASEGWDGTWNGESCSPGVFVYYLEGACANGQEIMKKGNVTLIR